MSEIMDESGFAIGKVLKGDYTFEEYHNYIKSSVLPQYPNFGDNLIYPALGQSDETGELVDKLDMLARKLGAAQGKLAGKFKKLWRDHGITKASELGFKDFGNTEEIRKLHDGALKEIGDVLWYLDALACTLGSSLAECAQLNVQKLTGRAERGTSLGSGDDR